MSINFRLLKIHFPKSCVCNKPFLVTTVLYLNTGFSNISLLFSLNLSPSVTDSSMKIQLNIHYESIIHSMVEWIDGSIKAQLGVPSMEIPIQYALSYPDRLYKRNDHLDFSKLKKLSFDVVDYQRFPALKLAYEAGKKGNSYPCVFNAANEVAVNEFLMGNIKFLTIDDVIKSVIDDHKMIENPTLEQIVEIDSLARQKALQACKNGGKL